MVHTMSLVQELRSEIAGTLVEHYPNWKKPGVCRCGFRYGDIPTSTWAEHASRVLIPVEWYDDE